MEQTMKDYLEPWVTYKFYDEKGRRLSIFAEELKELEENEMEITVITCSKHDQFSRAEAKHLYAGYNWGKPYCNPQTFIVPIKDNKPKWTFINWCRENYYHKEEAIFQFAGYVLAKGDNILPGVEPCSELEFVGLLDGKNKSVKEVKSGV